MQIAEAGAEAVMAGVVEVSTSPSPPGEAGEAGQVASLEALCDLWRESRGDQVPHICATLTNAVIHLDTASPGDSWSPVSSLDSVSSLHSGRNLGLVAALLGSLAILLAIAAYLATKYRAKQPAPPPSPEYELENLTGAKRKEESPPPEYHSVVIKDPDAQLPDYYDDCVKKVAVAV